MIPDDYYKEEVRDEFVITTERKKIWAIQIDLLEQIMKVCDKYHLTYFAVAGTMLGAIRHKGYIPWDDDLDIAMPRKDYEKLCEVSKIEFQEPYYFQYALSEKCFYEPGARLRNSNTTGIIERQRRFATNHGIFIDIFAFDNCPYGKLKQNIQFLKVDFLTKFISIYFPKCCTGFLSQFVSLVLQNTLGKFIPFERSYRLLVKECSKYNDINTKYISYIAAKSFRHEYFWNREDVVEVIRCPYEYIKISLPKGYDRCLKQQYGNYMKFPPVEQRGEHHGGIIQFNPEKSFYDQMNLYRI